MGWAGPWRAAAEHGWAALEASYRREDGLYRTLAGVGGEPLDETAWLYDQAFAALAMASLHVALPGRPAFSARADALLAALGRTMAHDRGFREAGDLPFKSNPHMHLLEAALAWIEAGGGEPWRVLAGDIVALALERMIDAEGGFIREVFDADWRPSPGPDGAIVEPGHQFEWAWLLDRWAELAGDEQARAAARRLVVAGSRGLDPVRQVAIDALDDHLAPLRATARLWPQTERLKAAARLARRTDGAVQLDWLAQARSAAQGLWRYLDVEPRGLWRDKQAPQGGFRSEPAPASSLYHLIGAVQALESLAPLAASESASSAGTPPDGRRGHERPPAVA
jgi:mannose/cellobiose epimerase-like protein (N-acyl-D-glucosamine 2-epimerase family)